MQSNNKKVWTWIKWPPILLAKHMHTLSKIRVLGLWRAQKLWGFGHGIKMLPFLQDFAKWSYESNCFYSKPNTYQIKAFLGPICKIISPLTPHKAEV